MKPFEYIKATSLEEVYSHLGEDWDTRIIAGGTDLLQEMKNDIIRPQRIIDIKSLPDFTSIEEREKFLAIGALVTLDEIESHTTINSRFQVLSTAASEVASPQLRSMATIAGNICQRPRCWYYRHPEFPCLRKGGKRCFAVRGENGYHAIFGGGPCHIVCPSDMAPVLVALGADIIVLSSGGDSRAIPIEDFFVGPKVDPHHENILQPGDLISEIHLPYQAENSRGIFLKARERKVWDFALASVTACVTVDKDSIIDASIVLGGVAPNPWRSEEAEDALRGKKISDQLPTEAAEAAVQKAKPMRDNRYKVDLVRSLVAEAVGNILEI